MFINEWLTHVLKTPHVFEKTTRVEIDCEINKNKVQMTDKAILEIQFAKNGSILEVEGGNYSPIPIDCPHFAKKKKLENS